MISMSMPVMGIRKMRMGVRQGRMLVQMLVGSPWCHWLGMRVGVVHVTIRTVTAAVRVLMVMQQRFVIVHMAVPLRQVQCDANRH
jgi:hypothetical protein